MAETDNLADLLGEATILALHEHLETLKMENPEEVKVPIADKPGQFDDVPNPLYIKIKVMKNKAASDILAIMSRVDGQSLKGRRTDRTQKVLDSVRSWKPSAETKQ